jgi:formylglycine-generating enzyme required for sulfatase activity
MWGETNEGAGGDWPNTNSWPAGAWGSDSRPSTNITPLTQDKVYYYNFHAQNAVTNDWSGASESFITGLLTVQASDPTGRATVAETAAFTVSRPAACTNEDLVLNYTLGGTASEATDYTISPASGTVAIAKGDASGIVTVTPVYQTAAEQTVVLTLTPGAYPVGTPNAATCTLAEVTGAVYNDKADGNWSMASTWDPGTGVPISSTDTAIIDSHKVIADIAIPLIRQTHITRTDGSGQGNLWIPDEGTQTNDVELAGGMYTLQQTATSLGTHTVHADSTIFTQGNDGNLNNHRTGRLGGTLEDGPDSTGRITLGGSWNSRLKLDCDGSGFSGGWTIPSWADGGLTRALYVARDGALGTGALTNSSDMCPILIQASQSAAKAPAEVVLENAGAQLRADANYARHVYITNWTIRMSAGTLGFGAWGNSWFEGGDLYVSGDISFYGSRDTRWTANNVYAGRIHGPGRITITAGATSREDRFRLYGDNADFSGGIELTTDSLYAHHTNALGTGDLLLHSDTGKLYLDATPAADWTLANGIGGTNTIQVEDGSGDYGLTLAGGTLDPGTDGSGGVLTVDGWFRFAGDGGAPARLVIDITDGAGSDMLAVEHGTASLASSIADCDLVVNLGDLDQDDIARTDVFTNLLAEGVNFTTPFASVTWNSTAGLSGRVNYNNGSITLDNIKAGLALDLMPVPASDGVTVTNHDFEVAEREITVTEYAEFLNTLTNGEIEVAGGQVRLSPASNLLCVATGAAEQAFLAVDTNAALGEWFSVVSGREEHPVIYVSWFGAAAYCNWLSDLGGLDRVYDPANGWSSDLSADGYRLPTEAEWYKAAAWDQAAAAWRTYGTGSDTLSDRDANYLNSGDDFEGETVRTWPVQFRGATSPYGLSDAAGNVWEWCHNTYETNGVAGQDAHALRGGGWGNLARDVKASVRIDNEPAAVRNSVGFRVARGALP